MSDPPDHLDLLIVALDPVVEILNRIPDDSDYRSKTWAAIQKIREACVWLGVAGVGYAAFLAGTSYSSSPYGDDGENNAHWRFGWRQACKDRKVPHDEMDSLWCTLNGTAAAEEIERLRIDLMNVRERLRLSEEDIGRKREALEAVQSEILLTGHLAEIVDGAIP